MPFLIGTKFDLFDELEEHHKIDITKQARKFAKKMRAPLIYCSSAQSINVRKIFKVIIAKVFDLRPKIKELHNEKDEPLIEFASVGDENGGTVCHTYNTHTIYTIYSIHYIANSHIFTFFVYCNI